MKRTLTRILTLCAAVCGLQVFGAVSLGDAKAVWDHDFDVTTKVISNDRTYTLDLNGNTLQDDGTIKITSDKGVNINFSSGVSSRSIIIKYSGISAVTSEHAGIASINTASYQHGLETTAASAVTVQGYSTADSTTTALNQSLSTTGSGYIHIAYSSGTTYYATVTDSLASGNQQGCGTRSGDCTSVSIGGPQTTSTTVSALTGMVIEAVAIYDGYRGRGEFANMKFPSDISVETPYTWYKFDGNYTVESGTTGLTISGENASNFVDTVKSGMGLKIVNNSSHPWGSGWNFGANGCWSVTVVSKATDQTTSGKNPIWAIGVQSGWLGLYNDIPNGKVLLAYGNASAINTICEIDAPSDFRTAYHLYTVTFTKAPVTYTLTLDDNVRKAVSTAYTGVYSGSQNFQIGSVQQGCPSGAVRTTGTVIDDLRIYQTKINYSDITNICSAFNVTTKYVAKVTGSSASWSDLTWTPSLPSSFGDNDVVEIENTSGGDTTVTLDQTLSYAIPLNIVTPSGTKLTLNKGSDNTLVFTSYNCEYSEGTVEMCFAPGTTPIKLGGTVAMPNCTDYTPTNGAASGVAKYTDTGLTVDQSKASTAFYSEFVDATVNGTMSTANKYLVRTGDNLTLKPTGSSNNAHLMYGHVLVEGGTLTLTSNTASKFWFGLCGNSSFTQTGGATVCSVVSSATTDGSNDMFLFGVSGSSGDIPVTISGGTFTAENTPLNFWQQAGQTMTVSGTGSAKLKGLKGNGEKGVITVKDQGVLSIGSQGISSGIKSLTMAGGTLRGYDTMTVSNDITLSAESTLSAAADKTTTVVSNITGTAALKVGSSDDTGTVVLSGANTYSGATTLNGGTLDIGASGLGASADMTIAGGTLNVLGSNTVATLHTTGAATLNIGDDTNNAILTATRAEIADSNPSGDTTVTIANGSTFKVTSTTDSSYKYTGIVLGEWCGTATLNVNGKMLATGTTVQPGNTGYTVNIGSTGVMAVNGFGAYQCYDSTRTQVQNLNLNGGTLVLGETGIDSTNDLTACTHLVSTTLTGGRIGTTQATLMLPGAIALNSGTTVIDTTKYTVDMDANTVTRGTDADTDKATITFSGTITGSGAMTADGDGTLALTGTMRSYSGTITLASGTLTVADACGLAENAVVPATGYALNTSKTGTVTTYTLIKTYTVTVQAVNNTTVTVTADGKEVTGSGNVYTVQTGAKVIVTYTAADGYAPQSTTITYDSVTENKVVSDNEKPTVYEVDENGLQPYHWYKFNGNMTSSGSNAIGFGGNIQSFVKGAKGVSESEAGQTADYQRPYASDMSLGDGSWTISIVSKLTQSSNNPYTSTWWTADRDGIAAVGFGSVTQSSGFALVKYGSNDTKKIAVKRWGDSDKSAYLVTPLSDVEDAFHAYTIINDTSDKDASGNPKVSLAIDGVIVASQYVTLPDPKGYIQFSSLYDFTGSNCEEFWGQRDFIFDDFRVYHQVLTGDQLKNTAAAFGLLKSVAKIGTTEYTTLQKAVDAASSEETTTITMIGNCDETVTIDKNIIITESADYLTEAELTIAENTTVEFDSSVGQCNLVVAGADPSTSKLLLKPCSGSGFGLESGSTLSNLTVETVANDGKDIWMESPTMFSGTVNLTANGTIKLNSSDAEFTVATLSGNGTIGRNGENGTFKITETSTYTGTISVPVDLAAGVALTLSAENTGISTSVANYEIAHTESGGTHIYVAVPKTASDVTPTKVSGKTVEEIVADKTSGTAVTTGLYLTDNNEQVAIIAITNKMATTIVAVPFEGKTAANVVTTRNLAEGDKLYAYDTTADWLFWKLTVDGSGNKSWTKQDKLDDDGNLFSTEAKDMVLTAGDAFMLQRVGEGTNLNNPFYIYGTPASVTAPTLEKGKTALLANPKMTDLDLNTAVVTETDGADKAFGDDQVVVPGDKMPRVYTHGTDGWGYQGSTTVGNSGFGVVTRVTDGKIPAGTGFWYKKHADSNAKIDYTK